MAIDQDKLTEFLHRFVGDLGATMAAGNVLYGDRPASTARGPSSRTAPELAEHPARPPPSGSLTYSPK